MLAKTQLSSAALRGLAALEAAGHEAWIVGGWVRDALLGTPSHDVDIATSAPWPEAAATLAAAGAHVIESGTAHGTVTAIFDGEPLEVTTFRVDGAYIDGRHPSEVRFVRSLEEDLARRDFTINALAWSPTRGLADPFGGVADLASGIIRAVGDPASRMAEDALRILRAVRFQAKLGFEIEPDTQAALDECAPLLAQVSSERIGQEMRALLVTGRVGQALRAQKKVLIAALPELGPMEDFPQKTPYHSMDVLTHVARVCDYVEVFSGGLAPETLRWAAFLHDIGKPYTLTYTPDGHAHFYGHPSKGRDISAKLMKRLALPKELKEPVLALVRLHDRPVAPTRKSVLSILGNLEELAPGEAPWLFCQLMIIKRADAVAKAPEYRDYAVEVDELDLLGRALLAAQEPYSISDLAIGGRELMAATGRPGGPWIRETLDGLLKQVQSGRLHNTKESLIKQVVNC